MTSKEHIRSNIVAGIHQNSVDILINNLADASLQIQEKDARIAELEAEVKKLKADMDLPVPKQTKG